MAASPTGTAEPRRLHLTVLCWAGLWLLYVTLAGSLSGPELLAGGLASLVATTTVRASGSLEHLGRMRWDRWWLLFSRVSRQVVGDTIRVLLSAVGPSPIDGRFESVPFDPGGDDPISGTRRALVVFGASVAPDSYVVAIDRHEKLLIVHRLVPKGPSPGRGDLQWPI